MRLLKLQKEKRSKNWPSMRPIEFGDLQRSASTEYGKHVSVEALSTRTTVEFNLNLDRNDRLQLVSTVS